MNINNRQFNYSNADLKKAKYIQFGLLSPEEIKNGAVCEITNPDTFDQNGNPNIDGVNDLRMGSSESKYDCATCKCNSKDCPGHFGYINLAKPVYHPFFIDICLKLLQCVCYKCGNILIDKNNKDLIRKINNPKTRLSKIYNLSKPKSNKFNICNYCKAIQPKYKKEQLKIIREIPGEAKDLEGETKFTPQHVLNIFTNILDEDIKLLGFNPRYSRPEWMIIQCLLVCPPQVRPSVSVDSSLRAHDDLTHQYNQILKSNIALRNEENRNGDIQDKYDVLQIVVANLMKNDLPSGQSKKKNGEPIKSISARLQGKEGRLRENLMGKRVDFSARSVISPDPNLEVDELGVPLSIATNLTFPEVVADYNKEKLQKLIINGPNKYPGAVMIRTTTGRVINLNFCKNRTDMYLENGYIVERHMQNSDYVIFNRQPSLHKMSMMGHRVHLLPYSTFRLNLSVTTPYNADFDGDEMNMHLPQSYETKSEIMNIMHVPKQIISPQSNRPVIGIVQDSLIGCKLFTSRNTFLTYEQTMELIMWIKDFDLSNLPMPCIMKPQPLWSGKQIFSLILPEQLNLTKIREDSPQNVEDKLNLIDNYIEIKRGELIQGIICKKTVGTSSGGIVHNIWTEVGPQKTMEFLGNCQKLINNYLLMVGWTIGVSDTICNDDTKNEIDNTLKNMKKEFSRLLEKFQEGSLESQPGKNSMDTFEHLANQELNYARDNAGLLVQKSLSPKNHLKNMVSAGSKGNSTNISQIIAFVGQQNVNGKRIPFNFYKRTLPHFLEDDYGWESKGFVENSFLSGLKPHEFFFHAMGGREGVIDTSIKTSQTGYNQRKLVKSLEDLIASYDGTIRDSLGHIIQFSYGEDGMAGEFIQTQKFETLNMDNATLTKNYKFFEKDENESQLLQNLKRFMEDKVVNKMQEDNLNKIKIRLNKEYEQIKIDRDDMRKIFINDDTINIPLNIKTIITFAKNENNINEFSKSDLNPLDVLSKVDELKQDLVRIKSRCKKLSKEEQNEDEWTSLNLFNRVLNYTLSTKNVIIKHRLTKEVFNFICKEIKSKFEQSLVSPGEMVGSIASQSIGEPATQMTLNTFHLAGVSFANVTLGVPRLMEILNLSKKIKTPSMTIYFKKEEGIYNNDKIFELASKMKNIYLSDIVSLSKIYEDPDIKNTIINEDKEMIDDYMAINGDEIEKNINHISPWVLRLKFKKELININMAKVEEKIREEVKEGDVLIIYSHGLGEKKMHIRFIWYDDKKEEKAKKLKSSEYLKIFEKKLLNLVSIGGINSIKKVHIKNIDRIKYNEETGELIKSIPNLNDEENPLKETIFQTEGTNLAQIFGIDEVDFRRTISNDIHDVYNTLGIEAARKAIIQEIRNVFNPYGIYVNYRHISILCDYMTQKGILIPINRHGLKKTGRSPMRKSTFEESVKILLEAGIFSEEDQLKGVSEKILLGQLTEIGTGYFDLLMDYKIYKEEMKKNNKEYSPSDDEQEDNKPLYFSGNNKRTIETNKGSFSFTPYQNINNNSQMNSPQEGYNPQIPDYYNAKEFGPNQEMDNRRIAQGSIGLISSYSPTTSAINNYSSPIRQGIGISNPIQSSYVPGSPNYSSPNINDYSIHLNKNEKNEENEEEEEEGEDENKKD